MKFVLSAIACATLTATVLLAGCVNKSGPAQSAVIEDRTQPGAPGAIPNRAVATLTNDARAALSQQDWQGAIVMAERGLRIDRREPSLYLILAQAYLAAGDQRRAQQFAEQGRRYAQPDSDMAFELNQTLMLIESR